VLARVAQVRGVDVDGLEGRIAENWRHLGGRATPA
jgi:hypothetical protein